MRKYKTHYWIELSDKDKWYDHKLRWWVNYDKRRGICSSSRTVYTMKEIIKVLRRLYHENYNGVVYITKFMNYSEKEGGHLTEDIIVDYNDKYKNEITWLFK